MEWRFNCSGRYCAVEQVEIEDAYAPLRVNVVSPGLTDTEAYAGMAPEARAAMLAKAASTLPAGRAGQVQDLAAGYLFLIDNPFVTGSVIDIDGGALIQ